MKPIDKVNFLIVEDDASTRDKIVQSLRDLGFNGDIHIANNGVEGLAQIDLLYGSKKDIDLVICDIIMPVMSGIELLKEVRQSTEKFSKIPFLMLTSKSEMEMVVTSVKLGASQYLIKPWDAKSLYGKLADALGLSAPE